MKSLLFIASLLFCLCFSSVSMAKQIAFTFDDAPRQANGYFDGPTRAKALIKELQEHGIKQAAFFATTSHLNEEGKARLKAYANAGHVIANHTHTHPDINKTSLEDYLQEITTAHNKIKDYPNFKPWFRFPYLREGDTQQKRDGVRAYLAQNGYRNAYITLNNYDWYIENLFQDALKNGKEVDFEKLKNFYIDVIIQGAQYYDELAVKYLGHSPKHVILLHEMDITALFVGDLADAFRENGWQVISPEKAYQDPIASYQTERIMKYNPGRIGEIAKDKGQTTQLWHHTLDEAYLKARFDKEVVKEIDGKDKQ